MNPESAPHPVRINDNNRKDGGMSTQRRVSINRTKTAVAARFESVAALKRMSADYYRDISPFRLPRDPAAKEALCESLRESADRLDAWANDVRSREFRHPALDRIAAYFSARADDDDDLEGLLNIHGRTPGTDPVRRIESSTSLDDVLTALAEKLVDHDRQLTHGASSEIEWCTLPRSRTRKSRERRA